MITITKEEQIADIDNRINLLSNVMKKHPENNYGFVKLYNLLLEKRNELIN